LRASELRAREPRLAPRLRGGAFVPDDRQVDPRLVVRALRSLVRVEPRAVTDLSTVDADVVVVAAGCASAALAGLPVRPIIGELRPGVLVATGHYRNGVLLTPVTADAVADLVTGGPDVSVVKPFGPDRFRDRTG